MRYIQLGGSGPTVSLVGLGGSLFGRTCDQRQTCAVVDAALASGINFVDTAEDYPGSETLLGSALRGRRHEVVIASKFGHPQSYPEGGNGAPVTVHASIERALDRLQTDYIDVYMLHFPDPMVPIAETLGAMHELVLQGKVRWLGVSNFAAWQIVEAQLTTRLLGNMPLLCVENRYNLLEREAEHDVLPVCRRYGLGMIPYPPLASGLLSGRYRRGTPPASNSRLAHRWSSMTEADFDQLEALISFAEVRTMTLLQVAIGWLAAQPNVGPVITGATTPEQIEANAAALGWAPTDDEFAELATLTFARE